MTPKQHNRISVFTVVSLLSFILFFSAHHADASWNLPSCNPDTVGPTDSSCNVAAPLNVSSSAQTKSGQLTVQNTINAGALAISNAYGGNGTVTITTSTGKSLNITHNDGTQSAVTITTNSNQPGFTIAQSGSGSGGTVTAVGGNALSVSNNSATSAAFTAANSNAGGTGIDVTETGNTAVGISVSMSGSTSYGVKSVVSNNYAGYFAAGGSINSAVLVQQTGSAIALTVAANSGTGAVVQSTSGIAATFTSGTAAGDAVLVTNNSTGSGLGVSTGGVTIGSIPVPSGWPIAGGQGVRATTSTSYGVVGYSNANTGYGIGVYGRADYNYGVVGYSDASYGVYANSQAAGSYGSASCNSLTANCAYLGGGTYAGNFAGKTYTSSSVTSTAVAQVYNTNTTGPNYGYGLTARTMTGSLTAITAPQGTALEGQAYNGYGILAYSQNGTAGLYGEANAASSKAIYGNNSNTGTGVSYGGYFTSNSDASTALYVQNLNAVGGTVKYGIQTSATTPSGVGISATSLYGKAGEFISTSGGYGVYVSGAGSTSGVDIHVNSLEPAITAGVGTIASSGGFKGGQFYPNEKAGNGVAPNMKPTYSMNASVGASYGTIGMAYDGQQIWATATNFPSNGVLVAINPVNGQQLSSNGIGFIRATEPVYAPGFPASSNDDIWVFSKTTNDYFRENRLTGATSSSTMGGITGTTGYPQTITYNGSSIWAGTTKAIIEISSGGAVFTRVSGTGNITDIIYANGYIWAADDTNNVVHKVNISTYTDTQITVGTTPQNLLYDGAHVWVVNNGSSTLTRINAADNNTKSYSISSLGTSPHAIAFDGANIWIGYENNYVGYFNISSESAGQRTDLGAYALSVDSLVFDGTNIWAGDKDTSTVLSIRSGSGLGNTEPTIRKGLLMYNSSGTVYCAYINGGGTWTTSTTLTECQ